MTVKMNVAFNCVVENDDVESILRAVATHFAQVARHVGNGEEYDTVTTLIVVTPPEDPDAEPVSLAVVPIDHAIVEAHRAEVAAEVAAHAHVVDPQS
jgi:hypothetical protein